MSSRPIYGTIGTDLVDKQGNQMYYRVIDSNGNEVRDNNSPGGYKLVPVNRFFHGTPMKADIHDIKRPKQLYKSNSNNNSNFDDIKFRGDPYRKVYDVNGVQLGDLINYPKGMNWNGDSIANLPQQEISKAMGDYQGRQLSNDYGDEDDMDISGGKRMKRRSRKRRIKKTKKTKRIKKIRITKGKRITLRRNN